MASASSAQPFVVSSGSDRPAVPSLWTTAAVPFSVRVRKESTVSWKSQDVDVSVDLTQNSITFRKRGKDTVLGVIPGSDLVQVIPRDDALNLDIVFRVGDRQSTIAMRVPEEEPLVRDILSSLMLLLFADHSYVGHYEVQPDGTKVRVPDESELSVFVGTWNVGNSAPPGDLSPWLQPGVHDVYAVGAQECDFRGWTDSLTSCFGEDYTLIANHSLMQMKLHLFVRNKLVPRVSLVATTREATGLLRVVGNKGGLGIFLRIDSTPMVFVSAHFAAHQGKVEIRNKDYSEILEGLQFNRPVLDIMSECHRSFWCGDLNYRIDAPMEEVIAAVESQEFDHLLEADQLIKEQRAGRVFDGWETQPPSFPPTYKYETEKGNTFEKPQRTYTLKKSRVPSWCDRILWRDATEENAIECVSYTCCDSIRTSDHSPVAAAFRVKTVLPYIHSIPRYILPEHPELCDEEGPYRFRITSFRGEDLMPADPNGLSDPYVVFHGDIIKGCGVMRTNIEKKTLNPVFANKNVPPLEIVPRSYALIKRRYLIFRVMDWDRLSSNDYLGSTILDFGLFEVNVPREFTVPVYYYGVRKGFLHGVGVLETV
mgnify:CR=1 FL=1